MKKIIVTVTDRTKRFFYDIEAPIGLAVSDLKDDIVEALNGYDPNLFLKAATLSLLCGRTGHVLQDGETLESAGVWNGDYLTLQEE